MSIKEETQSAIIQSLIQIALSAASVGDQRVAEAKEQQEEPKKDTPKK